MWGKTICGFHTAKRLKIFERGHFISPPDREFHSCLGNSVAVFRGETIFGFQIAKRLKFLSNAIFEPPMVSTVVEPRFRF